MANLPESPEWTAGVYQIERNDPVGGGPDGTANKPLRDLANRTRWLYQKFNTAFDGLGWIQLGIWEIGLEISLPTQIVNYQGSWYRYAGNLDEPHVISGASPDDYGNWINVNVGDVALRSELAAPTGFLMVGGLQVIRLTLANAKTFERFIDGQRVYLTDVGYTFVYNSSRNIIPAHAGSEITSDDELHKLVSNGGMLEFDDYDKLNELENLSYTQYQAKLRTNKPIKMISYGDSITWAQGPGGGQMSVTYPAVIAEVMSSLTQSVWTSQNRAHAGDTALVHYIRTINDGLDGDISTIMLGINDIKAATNNGNVPENVDGDSLYSGKNFSVVMRKFVARELLRRRCVVLLGTTQFVGGANISPMGNLTEGYVSWVYDSAVKSVANEFGCMFIDTKRDVIRQYGLSESAFDGVHLREEFLSIMGKKLAAVFMQQDYKRPCVMRQGSVVLPHIFYAPVSSNVTLKRNEFTNGTSPPFLGPADAPEAVGVMLPNDPVGGSVTIAVYIKDDNSLIFPSFHAKGPWMVDMILNNGARQPLYPSNVEIPTILQDPDYIVSRRSISGDTSKNRATERFSQLATAGYLHVTTAGWHMITFASGQNAGPVSLEGLVCDSWSNVKNNDINGGVVGTLFRRGSSNTVTGFVTGCTTEAVGQFNVSMANLVTDNYRVDVEYTEDASFIIHRVVFKTTNSFRILFYNAANALINPTSFRVTVIGGR
ncbi:SGNH/GDSL hydrolase family protein [Pectobacterium polaris]|uniref:SGNH/GDSL hydrolase family protein n=1 Tax=Pectobacterium polaris TaxID=2042057 RepID=A0AAW5G9Z1_9GAMM|nr:SGNH/GDSL hydrolase family protein [Pectobacterium polaris]MCL6349609.1 SGNH/GDSL hydrolase family protein [Pectobacterium polaris]MCL6367007.1 SGNH/GDSL hydrolase family protein [Pectobacterium polaris]